MRENYPFTGTGNVLRFCQGLVRIHIMNQILVVLDNDTEGRNTCRAIANLDLPRKSPRVTTLPDLDVCRSVRTIGPSGENREDINGRAVAIESFLDIWRDPADQADRPLVELRRTDGRLPGRAYRQGPLHASLRRVSEVRGYIRYARTRGSMGHLIAVCIA